MILIDGRKSTQEIVDEVKLTFFSDVVLEIGPQALKILQAGEGGWQEKSFWFTFALLLARDYHPKVKPRKVKHRPADSAKVQRHKDVIVMLRVARHRPPKGRRTIKYGRDQENIPKITLDRSRARQPDLWQLLWGNPDLAASIYKESLIIRKEPIK